MKRVQVTVLVDHEDGSTTLDSTTLKMGGWDARTVGDTAKLVAEKAWFGRAQPTLKKDGGRA